MNPIKVLEMVEELRCLKFFPNDAAVLNAIVRLCGKMCADEEQVRWLIDRITSGIYSEWPGIAEVRACFCARYKPKDGITVCSTVFRRSLPPDPTAPPRPEIAAPKRLALPPGHEVTVDPELEASIQKLAEKVKPPAPHPLVTQFQYMLAEITTAPRDRRAPEASKPVNLNFKPIDETDIARAVQENHERDARKAAAAAQGLDHAT